MKPLHTLQKLQVIFNLLLLLHLTIGWEIKYNDRGRDFKFNAYQVTSDLTTTKDHVVNHICSHANGFISIENPDLLLCIKNNITYFITPTTVQKFTGKIYLTFGNTKHQNPISLISENPLEKESWFNKAETCLTTGRASVHFCKNVVQTIIQKPCWFVHGVGQQGNNTVKKYFPEYWGNINAFMPQCNSFNFLYMDTKTYSWTSDILMKKVCSFITNGTMAIEDKYVFTHSMGGLIMTNSFMKGICSINKRNSRIYMSQPPLKGSMTARFVNNICKGQHGVLLKEAADYMNYCLPGNQGAYPAYFPMDPDNPQLHSVIQSAGIFSDGLMCGNCQQFSDICGGGDIIETTGLKAIATLSGLEFPNDGMVALSSCQVPNPKAPFVNNKDSSYYVAPMNHADGTCRNGDTPTQNIFPCAWFGKRYIST